MLEPLTIQALRSLRLLKSYLDEYRITNEVDSIPLEVFHLYTGTIIKNAKVGRLELSKSNELASFDFMISEIDTMFAVLGGSCIKYCEEIQVDDVPQEIIESYFDQMISRISDN